MKKEDNGFKLKELGQLVEFEILGIYNLEKVKLKEEADRVKLMQKHYLQELKLDWDTDHSNKDLIQEDRILKNLKPHRNLHKLSAKGHGGGNFP